MSERRQEKGLLEELEEWEAHEAEVLHGLARRLRLTSLLHRLPPRPVWAGFMFVNGFVTIGLLAALAMVCRAPLVFPSLGPTAFLFFFVPRDAAATPRNALYGHAIGLACGYGALLLTGLQNAPSAVGGVNGPRVLAAALSLAATGALMILFRVAHPPAGATTLIVSLGIITSPWHLLLIEAAVALLAAQAIAINRLAGLAYPLWGSPPKRLPPPPEAPAEPPTERRSTG